MHFHARVAARQRLNTKTTCDRERIATRATKLNEACNPAQAAMVDMMAIVKGRTPPTAESPIRFSE
jgi:hypothetical protein